MSAAAVLPEPEVEVTPSPTLILIDGALMEYAHQTIIDANAVRDLLLDIRQAVMN